MPVFGKRAPWMGDWTGREVRHILLATYTDTAPESSEDELPPARLYVLMTSGAPGIDPSGRAAWTKALTLAEGADGFSARVARSAVWSIGALRCLCFWVRLQDTQNEKDFTHRILIVPDRRGSAIVLVLIDQADSASGLDAFMKDLAASFRAGRP